MVEIPCPHCGHLLTCNLDALGQHLVCPKCHVILRLAKDDGEKPPLFSLRRLLRRKKAALGLAGLLLLFLGFALGTSFNAASVNGRKGGVVMNAWGLFVAHNELRVGDGDSAARPKPSTP